MIEINIMVLVFALIGVGILIFIFASRPKHNCAEYLHVKKHHTTKPSNYNSEHFDSIDYHLYCMRCDQDYNINFAHIREGVKKFLNSNTIHLIK